MVSFLRGLGFVAALLAIAPIAWAQSATENGRAVLKSALTDPQLRKRLSAEENLSLYVGRIRVGSLTLTTSEAGKALVFSDYLELRIDGVGQVSMRSRQTVDESGQLIDASLETKGPSPTGRTVTRSYTLTRKVDGFHWRKTINTKVEKRILNAPRQALALVPPLGFAARLPKAIKDSGNLAWSGIDLETGSLTRLRITAEPIAEVEFRGRKVAAKTFVRREAAARFKVLVDPNGPLLSMDLLEGRLRMVGGIEAGERYSALPDIVKGVPTDPVAAVIVFFRALGKNDESVIEASLDFEALFEASRSGAKEQKGEREEFKKALMETFRDEAWLREKRLSVNSGALETAEMRATIKGDQASVLLPGGGQARLALRGGRWRITRFEGPKKED